MVAFQTKHWPSINLLHKDLMKVMTVREGFQKQALSKSRHCQNWLGTPPPNFGTLADLGKTFALFFQLVILRFQHCLIAILWYCGDDSGDPAAVAAAAAAAADDDDDDDDDKDSGSLVAGNFDILSAFEDNLCCFLSDF